MKMNHFKRLLSLFVRKKCGVRCKNCLVVEGVLGNDILLYNSLIILSGYGINDRMWKINQDKSAFIHVKRLRLSSKFFCMKDVKALTHRTQQLWQDMAHLMHTKYSFCVLMLKNGSRFFNESSFLE